MTDILTILLNADTCPETSAKLLEKSIVDEMFHDLVPGSPKFGCRGIPGARAYYSNPVLDLYPCRTMRRRAGV
jgi:hypothetical protein